jgi:cyclophilin family peptidyl-prolyl cis-trans isomerase
MRRLIASTALVATMALPVLAGCGSSDSASADTAATAAQEGAKSWSSPPAQTIDAKATYTATLATSEGDITIALDPKAAPKTVNNFVFLSKQGFYDGVTFHRVIPGFVIQGGDPDGNGTGGPGYTFEDELPEAGAYKLGSVAMANSGPNTNGSQFFIITGDQGVALPPSYSLFGQVTKGQDVAEKISTMAAPGTETPEPPVTIEKVTVQEKGAK